MKYYAVILAGGVGKRMGNVGKPKQYLQLGSKPIIVHTVEKFAIHPGFERVLVLTPSEWVENTKDILRKSLGDSDHVVVTKGGEQRNDTIMAAIDWIEQNDGIDDETAIVTHDAVRPFISERIIEDNIAAMKDYDACDTVIPSADTVVVSDDGDEISTIPDRKTMFRGQTPQSFKALRLRELYTSLDKKDKDWLPDACSIFTTRNIPVKLVAGEEENIKVTYPADLRMAQALIAE